MARRAAQIIALLSLVLTTRAARATVDYCAVNHLTRECALLETGELYEPLGWESCACGERCDPETFCAELGYDYVGYQATWTVEIVLAALGLVAVVLFVLMRLRRRDRKRTP